MLGFIVGAIASGLAVYFWRDQIRTYVDAKLPSVSDKAARKLEELERGAEHVLDRAKSQIGENLRAGQQKLRTIAGSHTGHERHPDD
jgi:hypothetical protein